MFSRRVVDRLDVTAGPGAPVWTVPMVAFAFVSAARWCDHRDELVITAVAAGGGTPSVSGSDRGDLRLFRCQPGEGTWRQIGPGYAHDPVCLPGGGYVVHRGAGLRFLDDSGGVVREVRVGRFGWGPPSLSVAPSGRSIAWVRWRGDDRKLCLEDVTPGRSQQFRPSIHRYAWLDERTMLYLLGDGLRLLDLESGTTRRFARLHEHARRGVAGAPEELQQLGQLPADELSEVYGDIHVVGQDVWFSATLIRRDGSLRVDGLFRTDPSATRLHMAVGVHGGDRIEAFTALPDRSAKIWIATYHGTTIVERRETAIGPLADFLDAGWHPLASSSQPGFGFHQLS